MPRVSSASPDAQGWIPQLILHERREAENAMGQMIDIFGKDNYFVELHNHGMRSRSNLFLSYLSLPRSLV